MKVKNFATALLLTLSVVPALAFAHGHMPQKHDAYVTSSLFELKFKLTNGFKKKTCYDIEVDGVIKPEKRVCLPHNGTRNMSVWLDSPADKQTRHLVCSISDIPGMRTRMCTDSLTLFPAKSLGLTG